MSEAILTTDRLCLRRPAPCDLDGFTAFARSQRARYTFFARSDADAWKSFCLLLAHWDLRGYGVFAVTLRDNDTCLGMVGPFYPEGWIEPELGWLLWPQAEGKGIAHEAALAARGYVYDVLAWDGAVSYIGEENTRSIALAERLGAQWDDSAVTPSTECRVYRHPAPTELAA